jgi:hypothetical protein
LAADGPARVERVVDAASTIRRSVPDELVDIADTTLQLVTIPIVRRELAGSPAPPRPFRPADAYTAA